MVLPVVGKHNAIVVAHPDDETLWAGGLPIRFYDRQWTVICCSVPSADPIRAKKFEEACHVLGADWMRNEVRDSNFALPAIDLMTFDCIFTHNKEGEYGHKDHIAVHDWVCRNFKGNSYGFLGTQYELHLKTDEAAQKMLALQCYDHVSPYDTEVKWKALLKRHYSDRDFFKEGYDRI
jgi:LmbE family N-acetylglucosaminyl deacetylase